MNNVIDKAKELGIAITKSSEFVEYIQYKEMLEKESLIEIVPMLEQAMEIVNNHEFSKDSKILIDAKEILDKYMNNQSILTYIEKKQQLSNLLLTTNETLAHITGMDTANGCSGCSGCKKQEG